MYKSHLTLINQPTKLYEICVVSCQSIQHIVCISLISLDIHDPQGVYSNIFPRCLHLGKIFVLCCCSKNKFPKKEGQHNTNIFP